MRIISYLVLLANENTKSIATITCSTQRWIYSPDGRSSFTRLNTSNSKYTVLGGDLKINLTNFSGSDEGVYGCDQTGGIKCIQVYGEPYLLLLYSVIMLICLLHR